MAEQQAKRFPATMDALWGIWIPDGSKDGRGCWTQHGNGPCDGPEVFESEADAKIAAEYNRDSYSIKGFAAIICGDPADFRRQRDALREALIALRRAGPCDYCYEDGCDPFECTCRCHKESDAAEEKADAALALCDPQPVPAQTEASDDDAGDAMEAAERPERWDGGMI